jgi:hypothetical protein
MHLPFIWFIMQCKLLYSIFFFWAPTDSCSLRQPSSSRTTSAMLMLVSICHQHLCHLHQKGIHFVITITITHFICMYLIICMNCLGAMWYRKVSRSLAYKKKCHCSLPTLTFNFSSFVVSTNIFLMNIHLFILNVDNLNPAWLENELLLGDSSLPL